LFSGNANLIATFPSLINRLIDYYRLIVAALIDTAWVGPIRRYNWQPMTKNIAALLQWLRAQRKQRTTPSD